MTRKSDYVRRMFSEIAPRYDRFNTLLSFGLDVKFRAGAARLLKKRGRVLDACGGSGEMARTLRRSGFKGSAVVLDFSRPMLEIARRRLASRARFVLGDAERMPFRRGAFDGVMQGFGLRNLSDRRAFFAEASRVMKDDGVAVFLDAARPDGFLAPFYNWYFYAFAPSFVRLLGADAEAYHYLPASVRSFPEPGQVVDEIEGASGRKARVERTFAGVMARYVMGRKEKR